VGIRNRNNSQSKEINKSNISTPGITGPEKIRGRAKRNMYTLVIRSMESLG